MYRVRFNEQHTEGYRPAQHVDAIRTKLLRLLKRQRMAFSHREGEFEYYAPLPPRKRRASNKRTVSVRPLPKPPVKWPTCNWRYRLPKRLQSTGWPFRREVNCPLGATVFHDDSKWGAYCELHGDKALRRHKHYEEHP